MADISNLIGKLNNSNEEVVDQLNENNEHVSRTNNLIQNLTKVLTGNDLQEAEDKRELNSILKKLSERKDAGKSDAGKVTPDGGGGGLLGLLGKGLLAGAIGIIGTIIKILGAKSPLATAVKMLKESKIGKTFIRIFKGITGFFGKQKGRFLKVLEKIKKAKGPFLKGLKFLGRIFGRIFAIFTAINAFRDANKVFEETEGDFSTRLGKALGEFGASVLDALFGWIPTLTGHILEFFGAPKWLTKSLKEFDLKQEILDLVDKVSAKLEEILLFFMDGSFTKIITKQIPKAIKKFFRDLGDWFKVNVIEPVKNFIDNNETIKKIKEKSDILIAFMKEIPDKVSDFIDKATNPVKDTLKGIKDIKDVGIKKFFFGDDGKALDLPARLKKADDAPVGENVIEKNVTGKNLNVPQASPATVIVPVPAAGPSGNDGGSGTNINVYNGTDGSIRDAQKRSLQGPPSMFQFYPIP